MIQQFCYYMGSDWPPWTAGESWIVYWQIMDLLHCTQIVLCFHFSPGSHLSWLLWQFIDWILDFSQGVWFQFDKKCIYLWAQDKPWVSFSTSGTDVKFTQHNDSVASRKTIDVNFLALQPICSLQCYSAPNT